MPLIPAHHSSWNCLSDTLYYIVVLSYLHCWEYIGGKNSKIVTQASILLVYLVQLPNRENLLHYSTLSGFLHICSKMRGRVMTSTRFSMRVKVTPQLSLTLEY